jgi:hypothetical protein
MGCLSCGIHFRSTKSILDGKKARLYVNHVEGKVLIAFTLHGVWGSSEGKGPVGIQVIPFFHQIYLCTSDGTREWDNL